MILLVDITKNELLLVRQKIETNQRMIFKSKRGNQKDCSPLFTKKYNHLLGQELELLRKLKYLKTGNGMQETYDGDK